MDMEEYLRLFNEAEKRVGFCGAWEEMQSIWDPQCGPILVRAIRLCAVPVRVDTDLALLFLRSKLLGLRSRPFLSRILGELLHTCFTHRSPDSTFYFGEDARGYFDGKLRQNPAAYKAANRIAAKYFRDKRRALLRSGAPYTFTQIRELRGREVFHRLAFEGEKGVRVLKRYVAESIQKTKDGWRPIYGDIKEAPRGALWYALNVCADRQEFIPLQCQTDVDAFREEFLALGGKFKRIIVGHPPTA